MCIAGANHIFGRDLVELSAGKTVDNTRRNSNRSQHDRHRRSKIFAMPLPPFEQKIRNRIAWHRLRKLQRISIVHSQVVFNGRRFFCRRGALGRDLLRKRPHPRIKCGQQQVAPQIRNVRARSMRARSRQPNLRLRLIPRYWMLEVQIKHVSRSVLTNRAIIPFQFLRVGEKEKHFAEKRLQHHSIMNPRPLRRQGFRFVRSQIELPVRSAQ